MKTTNKTLATALVFFGMVGSAAAMTTQQDLFSDVQAAVGSESNVQVVLNGDVATLTGYVADGSDLQAAAHAAKEAGAEKVINLITQSN